MFSFQSMLYNAGSIPVLLFAGVIGDTLGVETAADRMQAALVGVAGSAGFATLQKLEDRMMRPFADWLTGMRMIVVFEKPLELLSRRPSNCAPKSIVASVV